MIRKYIKGCTKKKTPKFGKFGGRGMCGGRLLKIVKGIVEKNPIAGCNLNYVIHKILCVIRKKSILYIKYYALFFVYD